MNSELADKLARRRAWESAQQQQQQQQQQPSRSQGATTTTTTRSQQPPKRAPPSQPGNANSSRPPPPPAPSLGGRPEMPRQRSYRRSESWKLRQAAGGALSREAIHHNGNVEQSLSPNVVMARNASLQNRASSSSSSASSATGAPTLNTTDSGSHENGESAPTKLSPTVLEARNASVQARRAAPPAPPAVPPPPAHTRRYTGVEEARQKLEHLRPKLEAFYKVHNPSKIPKINIVLGAYGMDGTEEGTTRLNEALRMQYGYDLNTFTPLPMSASAESEGESASAKMMPPSRPPPLSPAQQPQQQQQQQQAQEFRSSNEDYTNPSSTTTTTTFTTTRNDTKVEFAPETRQTRQRPPAPLLAGQKSLRAMALEASIQPELPPAKEITLRFARALYDFEPEQEDDLGFKRGQIIELTDTSQDWWWGRYTSPDDARKELKGQFPKNYVEEISEAEALRSPGVRRGGERNRTLIASRAAADALASVNRTRDRFQASTDGVSTKISGATFDEDGVGVEQEVLGGGSRSPALSTSYPPEMVKDDKLMTHYFKAILEVATSELKYVMDLHLARKVFVDAWRTRFGKDDCAALFSVWEEMILVHETLLKDLDATCFTAEDVVRQFGGGGGGGGGEAVSNGGGGGGSGLQRRPSYFDSEIVRETAKAFVVEMKNIAARLDALESAYHEWCEDGSNLTLEQRRLREEMLSRWAQRQSQVFIKLSSFLKTAIPYIVNYPRAMEKAEKLEGEAAAFVTQLEQNSLLRGLKLRDFLIKPVQRVCKYPLLYREILKYVPDEATRAAVVLAQEKLMVVADQVNTMLKQSEQASAAKLFELRQCLRPASEVDALGLNQPSCRLLREGNLGVVSVVPSPDLPEGKVLGALGNTLVAKSQSIRGLLFADQLLIVEEYNNMIGRRRLHILHSIQFRVWHDGAIEVGDGELPTFTIRLMHPPGGHTKGSSVAWTFTTGAAARDGWVADLSESLGLAAKVRSRVSLAEKTANGGTHNRRPASLTAVPPVPVATPTTPKPPPRMFTDHVGGMMIEEMKVLLKHREGKQPEGIV